MHFKIVSIHRICRFHYSSVITGERWQDKVDRLRAELPKLNVDALVITALDEVAWLLNIRGLDVPNEPVLNYFYSAINNLKNKYFKMVYTFEKHR